MCHSRVRGPALEWVNLVENYNIEYHRLDPLLRGDDKINKTAAQTTPNKAAAQPT